MIYIYIYGYDNFTVIQINFHGFLPFGRGAVTTRSLGDEQQSPWFLTTRVLGPPTRDKVGLVFFWGGTFCQQFFGDSKLGKTKKNVTKSPNVNTLPETNIAHEILIFPSKYHQNGEFSMAMFFSWRVFLANILKTPTKWNHIDFEYSYQHVMEKMGEELIHAPSINTDSTYSKHITKFFQHTLFSCDMFFFHMFSSQQKKTSCEVPKAVDIVNT